MALVYCAWLLGPASAQSDAEVLEAARACRSQPELSARLACYDRVFPPTVDSAGTPSTLAPREEQPATLAPPASSQQNIVQIVEVEMPSLRTTRFRAADGRVFVRSNATTLLRWPDTPFEVEVQSGAFGTLYLKLLQGNARIRVALE